jgi:hypothetical protein
MHTRIETHLAGKGPVAHDYLPKNTIGKHDAVDKGQALVEQAIKSLEQIESHDVSLPLRQCKCSRWIIEARKLAPDFRKEYRERLAERNPEDDISTPYREYGPTGVPIPAPLLDLLNACVAQVCHILGEEPDDIGIRERRCLRQAALICCPERLLDMCFFSILTAKALFDKDPEDLYGKLVARSDGRGEDSDSSLP